MFVPRPTSRQRCEGFSAHRRNPRHLEIALVFRASLLFNPNSLTQHLCFSLLFLSRFVPWGMEDSDCMRSKTVLGGTGLQQYGCPQRERICRHVLSDKDVRTLRFKQLPCRGEMVVSGNCRQNQAEIVDRIRLEQPRYRLWHIGRSLVRNLI